MGNGRAIARTRSCHRPADASQLSASYERASQARVLAGVVGEEGVSGTDRRYLEFGQAFETRLVGQSAARSLEESMAVGWELLALLPSEPGSPAEPVSQRAGPVAGT